MRSMSEVQLDRVALEAAWMKANEALRGHAPELGPISRTAMMQVVVQAAIPAYLAALASPPKAGDPVAWRVKDFVDGWIYYTDEAHARRVARHMSGALVEPLYATSEPRGDGVRVKPLSLENFAADFNAAMERTGVTVRGLANELGVDKSAISRVRAGKQVTQSNFISMLNWLNSLEAALNHGATNAR